MAPEDGYAALIDYEIENAGWFKGLQSLYSGWESFISSTGERYHEVVRWRYGSVTKGVSKNVICTCAVASPIVLDLDGDGVETIGLGDSQVMFDTDGDGRRTWTGWLKADDGFLVYDRDGDGLIKDGREMFGNGTYKYDGESQYVNGFEVARNLKASNFKLLTY